MAFGPEESNVKLSESAVLALQAVKPDATVRKIVGRIFRGRFGSHFLPFLVLISKVFLFPSHILLQAMCVAEANRIYRKGVHIRWE